GLHPMLACEQFGGRDDRQFVSRLLDHSAEVKVASLPEPVLISKCAVDQQATPFKLGDDLANRLVGYRSGGGQRVSDDRHRGAERSTLRQYVEDPDYFQDVSLLFCKARSLADRRVDLGQPGRVTAA